MDYRPWENIYRELGSILSRGSTEWPQANASSKPILLSDSLKRILGSMGAVLVETRILNSLYSQMEISPPPDPILRAGHPEDFETYMTEVLEMVSLD